MPKSRLLSVEASTPVLERLEWVLGCVWNRESPSIDEVVMRLDQDFLEAIPAEDFISNLKHWEMWLGEFTVRECRPVSEVRAVLIIDGYDGETWRLLTEVEGASPHRLSILYIEKAPYLREGIQPPTSWEDFEFHLSQLGQQVGLCAVEVIDGEVRELAVRQADEPFAVSSSFKLTVLAALASEISDGNLEWDVVVAIRDSLKSPGSGMMNDPQGTQYQVEELARAMIERSDNTATDHLIGLLGRPRVENTMAELWPSSHALNSPLLTTREMFELKTHDYPNLIGRYAKGNSHERRRILEHDLSRGPITLQSWAAPRFAREVEWFASCNELISTLVHLRDVSTMARLGPLTQILSANPGFPFDPKSWPMVFFKGGSEPGVSASSWLVQRHDGRSFAISLVVNDDAQPINSSWSNWVAAQALGMLKRAQ